MGHGAHSHKKNRGNRPIGSTPGCQNVFFIINARWLFGHLPCTNFDHFWTNCRESLSACVHRWKFPNFCTGFSMSKKQLIFCAFDSRVFMIELQVKRHNFRRWESFSGLVNIPSMSLLYVSFAEGVRFGRYERTKNHLTFGDRSLRLTLTPLKRVTIFFCSPGGSCSSKR